MYIKGAFIIVLLITFSVTLVLTKWLIKFLNNKKVKQNILEIGPIWHKSKEGTPTMGGVAFVVAASIAFVVVCLCYGKSLDKREFFVLINTFSFSILNSLVGIIDDLAKVRKKKNEGLTPKGKLIFQGIIAAFYLFSMRYFVGIDTTLYLPYFNVELELGIFFYLFSFLLLCGIVNAVNLTDGLDGLASVSALSVGIFLVFAGYGIYESLSATYFGAVLIGSTLAFLVYNLHPAKIFMGDTGSLFLGAIVVGSGFVIDNPLLVLIYGFVFVLEALSVILQVLYFKLTHGKRLFKMAPFHHHLEKCGLSEMKIVSVFGVVSAMLCFLACFGLR